MAELPVEQHRALPDWATAPFTEFLDHQEDLGWILHLSISGISMLRGRHDALRVLAEVDGRLEGAAADLKRAERERDLAQREVDNGFLLAPRTVDGLSVGFA